MDVDLAAGAATVTSMGGFVHQSPPRASPLGAGEKQFLALREAATRVVLGDHFLRGQVQALHAEAERGLSVARLNALILALQGDISHLCVAAVGNPARTAELSAAVGYMGAVMVALADNTRGRATITPANNLKFVECYLALGSERALLVRAANAEAFSIYGPPTAAGSSMESPASAWGGHGATAGGSGGGGQPRGRGGGRSRSRGDGAASGRGASSDGGAAPRAAAGGGQDSTRYCWTCGDVSHTARVCPQRRNPP